MQLQKFIEEYPILYHMAENGTWPSIETHGLLSTTAALDIHGINGIDRLPFESMHRASMMSVQGGVGIPQIILRDQKPMPSKPLLRALPATITPQQWYEFLNAKVFLWATKVRLETLLNGKEYRNTLHDVLEVDTESFVSDYGVDISLCHMNSGNVFPYPHLRDYSIFKSIESYPEKSNGSSQKKVAEVTVRNAIPNISKYVVSVKSMRGTEVINVIK